MCQAWLFCNASWKSLGRVGGRIPLSGGTGTAPCPSKALLTRSRGGMLTHSIAWEPMRRRTFIAGIGSAVAWPLVAQAQRSDRPAGSVC